MANWLRRFHLKTKPTFSIVFFLQQGILMARPSFVVSWTDHWLHGHHHTPLSTVAGEKLWHTSVTIHSQILLFFGMGRFWGIQVPDPPQYNPNSGTGWSLWSLRCFAPDNWIQKVQPALITTSFVVKLKQEWTNAKHWPGRFLPFQDDPTFFSCSVTGFYASVSSTFLCQVLCKCATQRGFSITAQKKPQMLQKFPLPWVWTCPAPALDAGISLLFVAEFGRVWQWEFPLSPLTLAAGVAGPSSGLPVPTQPGGEGVGWEQELRNFGLAPLAQQGSQEGNAAGAKHNANTDCCFWKGGNPGATTKALLCSWDNSAVCCPWAQQNEDSISLNWEMVFGMCLRNEMLIVWIIWKNTLFFFS